MSLNQDDVVKATKKNVLTDLCNRLDFKKQSNKCQIPHNFVSGLIHSHKTVFPWLTRDTINNELRRRKGAGICSSVQAPLITTGVTDVARTDKDSDERKKGGRPLGSTDKSLKMKEDAVIATKNEITEMFSNAKKKAGKKG